MQEKTLQAGSQQAGSLGADVPLYIVSCLGYICVSGFAKVAQMLGLHGVTREDVGVLAVLCRIIVPSLADVVFVVTYMQLQSQT